MDFDLDKLKFGADGLIVAIAVDCVTNRVLMQAYMNRESLNMTMESGYCVYYSRSRKALWKKGETSGNVQKVVEILTDCDSDSLLLRVRQTGGACHTGKRSCFFNTVKTFDDVADAESAYEVAEVVKARREHPEEGSYTNYLLEKGNEKICKKVGEEASECIIAAMKNDKEELKNELADLFYHASVLMVNNDLEYEDVLGVLKLRHSKPRKREY